jgi:hypothetical protein
MDGKPSSSAQDFRVERVGDDESLFWLLHQAASAMTAALFAIELIKKSELRELDKCLGLPKN